MKIGSLTLTLSVLLAPCTVSAATLLDRADALRDALADQHLKGDQAAARRRVKGLLDETTEGDPLAAQTRASVVALGADAGNGEDAAREIAFATGRKAEYYCRGKGLVLVEGQHSDGSTSRLVLVSGDRRVADDAYALMTGDQWVYELTNSFRQPARSQVWMTYGDERTFNVFEARDRDGGVDRGSWDSRWDDQGNTHRNFSVTGIASEPARIFMAMHYHLWGSQDLGFRLRFEPGYQDSMKFFVSGKVLDRIYLESARTVAEHLPRLTVADAAGGTREYEDCYRVDLVITHDRDRKD